MSSAVKNLRLLKKNGEFTEVEREIEPKKKINLGCGNVIKEGWLNVDKYNPNADEQVDLLKPLPYEDNSFDEAILIHVIEHISWRKHIDLLEEIHRILKPGALLVMGFPDFEEAVKAFFENRWGERWAWWVQTLYGSQTDPGQYHVAPITREHITQQLSDVGFTDITYELDGADAVLTCKVGEPRNWF